MSNLLRVVAFLCMVAPDSAVSAEPPGSDETVKAVKAIEAGSIHGSRQVITQGLAVELTLDPVGGGKERSTIPREGEEAEVRFTITDATTGTAIAGLQPTVWMDLHEGGKAKPGCKEKIRSFLQGSLAARPTVDLNTYHILTLNHEANISVIDPLLGFGSSRLLALVMLKGPGKDWVLSQDGKRLFVTIPKINQVAVVDTTRWKVAASIDVGPHPRRLALQSDGKYLWVGEDAPLKEKTDGGVTVIDLATLTVAARIQTGMGPHEIAFSSSDRYAVIANRLGGTLSIVDVERLKKIKDLTTGRLPTGLAFSPLSKRIYASHEAEGTIVTVDVENQAVVARMKAQSGLRTLRFAPDGRWGFAVNTKDHLVHIFDAATNRILHTVKVGKEPDQITFTGTLAYIRSLGTHEVSTIPLGALAQEGPVPVLTFSGGQIAPGSTTHEAAADAIIPAPKGNSVLVANPADKTIYYYMEGMAAPMGSFQNYRREPKAVLVVDRSVRETGPGVYTTTTRLPKSGTYDIAFLLDSPRISHCFDLRVEANPTLRKDSGIPLRLEVLLKERRVRVGETIRLQFRLTDFATSEPKVGLQDVRVLMLLSSGVWQKRERARPVADGIYEVSFSAPRPGVYYVFFGCPSLQVRFDQLPKLILQATDQERLRDE